MATGTQVPWTSPGGTPCCCVGDCFDATGNGPYEPTTNDSWFNISNDAYNALLAGGNYTFDLDFFIYSWREAAYSCTVDGVSLGALKYPIYHKRSISVADSPLPANLVDNEGCHVTFNKTGLSYQSETGNLEYPCREARYDSRQKLLDFSFSRIVGTAANGQRQMNCASVTSDGSYNVFMRFLADGLFSGPFNEAFYLDLVVGNNQNRFATGQSFYPLQQYLPYWTPTILFTVQLLSGPVTYTVPNAGWLMSYFNVSQYTQFHLLGFSTVTFPVSGSVDLFGRYDASSSFVLEVKFTPSAP